MAKPKQNLYFLAIVPEGQVYEDVQGFKEEIFEHFGSKGALRSPPHITIHMPFKWRTDREEELLEILAGFQYDNYPIAIQLDGFDFFEDRVIFVHVEKSKALGDLQKKFTAFARKELRLFNADYKDRGFHPHMTIGFRDLKKAHFPAVRERFASRKYAESFEANDICLLKHDGEKWELYQRGIRE